MPAGLVTILREARAAQTVKVAAIKVTLVRVLLYHSSRLNTCGCHYGDPC